MIEDGYSLQPKSPIAVAVNDLGVETVKKEAEDNIAEVVIVDGQ